MGADFLLMKSSKLKDGIRLRMLLMRGLGRIEHGSPPPGACFLLLSSDMHLLCSTKSCTDQKKREIKNFPSDTSVTIHDYKLLELRNTSMIGSERYAEAMKIAPGQQRFRGAFTKKPSME